MEVCFSSDATSIIAAIEVLRAIAAVATVVPLTRLPEAVIAETLVSGQKDILSISTITSPSMISAATGSDASLYIIFALNELSTNVNVASFCVIVCVGLVVSAAVSNLFWATRISSEVLPV